MSEPAPIGSRITGRTHAVTIPPPIGAPAARPRPRSPMTPGVSRASRLRAYVAGSVLTLGLCGVGYKAWGLQVDGAAHWREEAERQHVMTVNIAAPRGEILDSRGRPLAVTADADSVWANPRELASMLTGRPDFTLVDRDASPAGPRTFVVLNPAVVDPLTGVLNRRGIETELLEALKA